MIGNDELKLRQSLLGVVRRLEDMGYNHGSSGNVSCRVDEDFLITPTGASSANLTAGRIVRLRADGATVGDGIPSSEWSMHLAVLRAYPEINAVVHTHSDCCVALSCLGTPIPAFHYMVAGFGGNDVPCASYATFGTPELAASAVSALAGRKACLLANHGMLVVGKDLETAFGMAVKLETLAHQYILACHAGRPIILSDGEMERVKQQYVGYGTQRLPPLETR